jgi:hypothetical protein
MRKEIFAQHGDRRLGRFGNERKAKTRVGLSALFLPVNIAKDNSLLEAAENARRNQSLKWRITMA